MLPHGNLKFDAFAGQIEKSGGFETEIDPNADKSAGNLTVTLSPSLVSGMVQSLDSLIQFPYGCVEQTMSRFMPAILVSKTLKESGLIKPELDQKVPLIAADGFARLAKMQHDNGGWGWWEYDDSSIFMTSWVLDGLLRASKAGYATPDSISVEKALDWASSQANTFKSEGSLTDKVFLIYALAEHGRTKVAQEAMDRLSFDRASAGELALAALAEHALGRTSASGRYLDRLRSSAKTSSETAYWDSTGYYWYGSEDTSLALLAFTTCASRDDLIPKIIRYLMQSKSGEGWSSTRATSITLAGLCEHISTHPISTDPSTVSLIVNGKTLRNWTLDKASLLNPDLRVEIPIKDLPTGKNKIEFTRTGNGFSYYSAAVKQYIREKNIVQVIQDVPLRVERNYYLLSAQQVDDGTMKLMPSKRPISEAKSGDIIRCELTIRAASQESYVLIEDAVPSNCRVTEREDPGEDSSWNWWWSSTVIRDDRISFFARSVPAGVNKITYTFRAESPGISAVLPTRVGNMYNPSSTVMGGENRLKVMR